MSIINFKSKKVEGNTTKNTITENDIISFKDKEKIPEYEPVTEEPVFGYVYPMGQFMITNIPNIGCFATLMNKDA